MQFHQVDSWLWYSCAISNVDDKAAAVYYPHVRSCTKFFECVDKRLEEYECPKGTFFDKSKEKISINRLTFLPP